MRGVLGILIFIVLAGCASRGPQTVQADAFDYSAAIADSRTDQMLMNIVRARYMTVPNFLTVSSVIAGYTYEGGVNATVQGGIGRFDEEFVGAGANLKYIERPTISYKPLTGDDFALRLMRNIPVEALFSLGQAGWPMDVLFRIAVERLGDTKNMSFSTREVVSKAEEQVAKLKHYDRVIDVMMELADIGILEVLEISVDGESQRVLRFATHPSPEINEKAATLKTELGLDPQLSEFVITDHITGRDQNEILIQTRSLLAIMNFLGMGVEVPNGDLVSDRVMVAPDFVQDVIADRGPMRIYSSEEMPAEAYAMVRYRGHWFYIDVADHLSKRTFATMLLLFELAAPAGGGEGPLLSLPAG